MLSELKKRSLKSVSWIVIILFAVSGVLFYQSASGISALLEGKKDLDMMYAEEIKPGVYVEGTVWGIYDYYAYTERTKNGVTSTNSKEYIIPVGEAEYLGLFAPSKDIKQCEALMEETWDFLDGKTDTIDNIFRVEGTILPMDAESMEFYKEYLELDSMSAEEQAAFLPYYLKIGNIGTNPAATFYILVTGAVLLAICGIYILVKAMTGGYQKAIKKYLASAPDKTYALSKLERFYESTAPVHGLRVSQDLLMLQAGAETFLCKSDELLWAYQQTTTHRTNGIKTGTSFSLLLKLKEGKFKTLGLKKEADALEVLSYISQHLPHVIIGYTKELDQMYRKDRQAMIRLSDERKVPEEDPYARTDYNIDGGASMEETPSQPADTSAEPQTP